MRFKLKTMGVAAIGLATQAAAQITFYEGDGFHGVRSPSITLSRTSCPWGSTTAPVPRSSTVEPGRCASTRTSRDAA